MLKITQFILEVAKHWTSKVRVSQAGVEVQAHKTASQVRVSQVGVETIKHLGHQKVRVSQFGIEVMRENVVAHYVDSAARTPFAQ